jgi:hypothetical protein
MDLDNLRLGFACKERWEDMVGDDRVRACAGCHRDVYNLSAMTRDEAEALLAARGITPCVRFYRRPDGTVMTTDCPTSRRKGRSLAVVAAGATLASAAPALADDGEPPEESVPAEPEHTVVITQDYIMGLPAPGRDFTEEVGVIIVDPEKRPAVEWSVWGRLGVGIATEAPDAIARRVTTSPTESISTSMWQAALAADVTLGIARGGDVRLGAWGEVRTSSEPVVGGELVFEGLTPHSYTSRIGRAGSLVLRAGGNARVITGALGVGYVGAFPRFDPWIRWARHVVGARAVLTFDRSLDDPRDWSATIGLEIEPIGALHGLYDTVVGR